MDVQSAPLRTHIVGIDMRGIHSRNKCRTRRSTNTHCPINAGIAYTLCRKGVNSRSHCHTVTETVQPRTDVFTYHTNNVWANSISILCRDRIPPALTSCDTVQAAQTALPYKKECIICFITVHFIQSVRLSKKDTLRNTIFIKRFDGKIIFLSHREGT